MAFPTRAQEEQRQLEESAKRGRVYANWHDACKASRFEKAITRVPTTIRIPRGTYRVKIIKPLRADPYAVYATAEGIRVHDWKPSNSQVDGIRQWRAF